MSWLADFYFQHPEYRKLRIAKRSRDSIHFEIEPGKYEAHFLTRPMFERGASGLWLPVGNLAKAVRMGIALSQQPRLAWELAKALPFAASPYSSQPDEASGYDTYIDGYVTTYNNGIATGMYIGCQTNAAYKWRGLLKFDVSSIPATATLTAATLTLRCVTSSGVAMDCNVHRALTQWYEGAKNGAAPDAGQDGSTWQYRNKNGNVAWGAAGGQSGTDYTAGATATVSITGTGAFDFNVLTDAAAWVAGSATNYGQWLISTTTFGSNYRLFASSSHATASYRPKLYITYTEATTARSFAVIVG